MNEEKLKSYWNRPGGKFGTIALLAGLGVAGFYLLPILTAVVWNTVNFLIALAVGAAVVYCITDRRLRLSLMYFYEILMKNLVGLVITIDPFVIAEDLIEDMKKDRMKLREQSLQVDQQKEALDSKIREKQSEKEKQKNLMIAAQSRGESLAVTTASRQIGRVEEFITKLSPIRDALTKVGEHLAKIYKNSAYMIDDAQNELDLKKDLYQSVTKGSNALNQALRLFNGDPEKKLLAAQSMEYLKDDIAGKMANMKLAMSETDDFVQKIDLENAAYEQSGLNRLAELSDESNFKITKEGEAPVQPATHYDTLLN